MHSALARLPVAALAVLLSTAGARAADLAATVTAVNGDGLTLTLSGDQLPMAGDKADLYFKVPGLDDEVAVGTAVVQGAEGRLVSARFQGGSGKPAIGHLARIRTAAVRPPAAASTAMLPATTAPSGALWRESFEKGGFGSFLADPQGRFQVTGGVARLGGSTGPADRAYLRTTESALHAADFVFEVTVNSPSDPNACIFVGLGSGAPNPAAANEPQDAIYLRIHSPDFVGGDGDNRGRVDVARLTGAGPVVLLAQHFGNLGTRIGSHRVRLSKTGDRLTFALDREHAGAFHADLSWTLESLSQAAPFLNVANARLFFGAGRITTSFDDVVLQAGR